MTKKKVKKDVKQKEEIISVEEPIVEKEENKELIITREIDTSELQNYLREERKELEDTLYLNELAEQVAKRLEEEEKEREIVEEKKDIITIDQLIRDDYTKEQIEKEGEVTEVYDKRNIKQGSILILLIIIFISICIVAFTKIKTSNSIKEDKVIEPKTVEENNNNEEISEEEYNKCLTRKYNIHDTSDEIEEYITDINSFLSTTYNVSIIYKEIEREFTYTYNTNRIYYAASTIKALDALYIYTKASTGEINLDDTLTYDSRFQLDSSKYMSTKKYGEQIPIRDLVKYAVLVSDNTAHNMLINYISIEKLREFGLSLGAKITLNTGDIFGNITPEDAIIYMQSIYNFINSNPELGQELKSYFINAEQNDIALPENNIEAAHKYGEYGNTYHDIGIIYDKHPYLLVVLTEEGAKDFQSIVKDISKKIYELHKLYNTNRESYCKEAK